MLLPLLFAQKRGDAVSRSAPASAASRLGGFFSVKSSHLFIAVIYQAVGIHFAGLRILPKTDAHQKASVFPAGVDVHVSPISLVYPFEAFQKGTAMGTKRAGDG